MHVQLVCWISWRYYDTNYQKNRTIALKSTYQTLPWNMEENDRDDQHPCSTVSFSGARFSSPNIFFISPTALLRACSFHSRRAAYPNSSLPTEARLSSGQAAGQVFNYDLVGGSTFLENIPAGGDFGRSFVSRRGGARPFDRWNRRFRWRWRLIRVGLWVLRIGLRVQFLGWQRVWSRRL